MVFTKSPTNLRFSKVEALLKTARVLASDIHLERLLVVIAEQVTEVLDAERSSVLLYDAAQHELHGMVVQGLKPSKIRIPVGQGLAGYAAQTKQILNVPNAQGDLRFTVSYDAWTGFRTQAVLCAPILGTERQLVGVIQVLNKRSGRRFTREDEMLLEAFSAHAALAIERAHLVEQYAEQQRLQASLQVAQAIQMSMLPQTAATTDAACYDLYAHLQSAQTVGGDLYDFYAEDEYRLGFAIGDVSDKGVPAALFANGTSTLLRLAASEGLPPDACFANINRVQQNQKGMFVTVFYGLMDLRTGVITYGNAGHPPPCIAHRDGTVTFAPRAQNLPLCLLTSDTFQVNQLHMEPGDLLVLYTDGVLEAANTAGAQFGQDGLQRVLGEAAGASAREAVERLLEAVERFTAGMAQRDDLTLLALRYEGMAT